MTRTRIGVNAAWVPAVYVYVALVVRRRGITSVAVITCSSWTTRNANSCHTTTNRYTNTAGMRALLSVNQSDVRGWSFHYSNNCHSRWLLHSAVYYSTPGFCV